MDATTYTLDEAAARLNIGRNTLARRLRNDARMLDACNLPTPRYRGSPYMRVRVSGYNHPALGRQEYHRVLFTRQGLRRIASALKLTGVEFADADQSGGHHAE